MLATSNVTAQDGSPLIRGAFCILFPGYPKYRLASLQIYIAVLQLWIVE